MVASAKTVVEPEQLLTVLEVAELWRCSKNTVYRLIASGELRIVDIGTNRAKTRVPASSLAEYNARKGRTAPRQRGAA